MNIVLIGSRTNRTTTGCGSADTPEMRQILYPLTTDIRSPLLTGIMTRLLNVVRVHRLMEGVGGSTGAIIFNFHFFLASIPPECFKENSAWVGVQSFKFNLAVVFLGKISNSILSKN